MAPPKDIKEELIGDLEDFHRNLLEEEDEEERSYGCLICGNHPFFFGHFENSKSKLIFRYCLCSECYEKPETEGIVKKIFDHYGTTCRWNPSLLNHWGES